MRGLRFIGSLVVMAVLPGPVSWAPVAGGEKGKSAEAKAALPSDLARVPSRSVGFLSVRVADVLSSKPGKALGVRLGKELDLAAADVARLLGVAPAEVERLTIVLPRLSPASPMLVVRTCKPFDRKKAVAAFGSFFEEVYKKHTLHYSGWALLAFDDKVIVIGPPNEVKTSLDAPVGKTEPLTAALAAAAGDHAVVLGLDPGALADGIGDRLPPTAKRYKALLKAQSLRVTFDLGAEASTRLRFANEKEAKAGEKALTAGIAPLLRAVCKEMSPGELTTLLGKLEGGAKDSPPKRIKDEIYGTLTAKIDQAALEAMARSGLARFRLLAARRESFKNLKHVAFACHRYAVANGITTPPAGLYDKDGRPLLSWRVLLLPYLGRKDLYKQFKLDEAWDGPNNKKLLAKMPRVYAAPAGKAKPHETFYQAFVGPGAGFEGKRGTRFDNIPDGTSNTMMFAEAARAVPWSKPEDLAYDPKKPLPKVGGLWKDGFFAAFFDGSVRFKSNKMKETTLRAYITRDGGEIIDPNDE
jgi:hypothetical protein